MKIKYRLGVMLMLGAWRLFSQQGLPTTNENEPSVNPAVVIIARAYKDSICLRWAATTPSSWLHTNKVGFVLERYTLLRNGQVLANKEKKILSPTAIKPFPKEQWEPMLDANKYALLYASALYGESFQLNAPKSDIMSMINTSREQDSKHSFALLAADMSVPVAKAAGLWYTDKNINKGDQYVYKIYPAKSHPAIRVDTGFVFIGPDETSPLPKPLEFSGEWGDRIVNLSWNRKYFERTYITYFTERSEDNGKTFTTTSDLPIFNLTPEGRPTADYYYKVDSLPYNEKQYVFRVRGLNSFGEIGPPSDTIRGMGMEAITAQSPVLYKANPISDGSILLQWKYEDSAAATIKGFIVSRASMKEKNTFSDISPVLPVTTRSFSDLKPLKAGYYIIKAVDPKGRQALSFPILGQLRDSIAPLMPIGIRASIDSVGIVRVQWKANKEEDLLGYRVFRSNSLQEEFTQITIKPIQDSSWVDTVSLNTLTRKVFYKIVAVDQHYNPSAFSKVCELKRPDKIAPSAPLFGQVQSVAEGIQINWIASSSSDVLFHVLYKRLAGEKKWITLAVFDSTKKERSYLDRAVEKGKEYEYTMLAVDDSKLESDLIRPLLISHIDDGKRALIARFKGALDNENKQIQLRWDYPDKTVTTFYVYRTEKGNKLRFYRKVSGNTFNDKEILPNTVYVYRVRAVYSDGIQSDFSEALEIEY